jgi:predicted GNAT superfamily acetyltransferase
LPDSVSALRRANPDYLLRWRLWLRGVMMSSFAQGYQVVDCVLLPGHEWHYILTPAAGVEGS